MKNSFALAYTFLALFFLFVVSVSSNNVIQDACQKAANGNPKIKVDFCVATLEANPNSKTATNVEALVPISIDIAISNAARITSDISKLLESKTLDANTRSCLETCSKLYSEAPEDLQSAAEVVKSKDYATANMRISGVMDTSDTCEEEFKEKGGLVSPLTKENDNFSQLTALPLALMKLK